MALDGPTDEGLVGVELSPPLAAKASGAAKARARNELATKIVLAAVVLMTMDTSRRGIWAARASALRAIREAESGHPCDKDGRIAARAVQFFRSMGLQRA